MAREGVQVLAWFDMEGGTHQTIRGAGWSSGGHTRPSDEGAGAAVLETMTDAPRITWVDRDTGVVDVDAGATWEQVLREVVLCGFAVDVAQSYYNFSVGGSLGVNCHGRSLRGALSTTMQELDVVLASGQVVRGCSRDHHPDLFRGVVGGYGLVGRVTRVRLQLVRNQFLECVVVESVGAPVMHVEGRTTRLWNANIYVTPDLHADPPPSPRFVNYLWVVARQAPHHARAAFRLVHPRSTRPENPWLDVRLGGLERALRENPRAQRARAQYEPQAARGQVLWRSYAMQKDARELAADRRSWGVVRTLQEYFVPKDRLGEFLAFLLPRVHEVEMLNLSVRWVPAIPHADTILNYAPVDSFAVVLYFDLADVQDPAVQKWTDTNLARLVQLGGKYYLPYHRVYDPAWIRDRGMYNWDEFWRVKRRYDPEHRWQSEWSHTLWPDR